eukprot:229772-Pelagomonas_calceolata.AAC.1
MEALLLDCCCWRGQEELCSEAELHKQSRAIHKQSHSAKHTLELMHATPTELSPRRRPRGFFCFAGCPFLEAWPWQAWHKFLRAGWELQASAT